MPYFEALAEQNGKSKKKKLNNIIRKADSSRENIIIFATKGIKSTAHNPCKKLSKL